MLFDIRLLFYEGYGKCWIDLNIWFVDNKHSQSSYDRSWFLLNGVNSTQC
jgi:hypothetical protein